MGKKIKAGDLVCCAPGKNKKNIRFMMWHKIDADGKPDLTYHSHNWCTGDLGIIIDVFCSKNNEFFKILTSEGGFGWVLSICCKKPRNKF